MHSVRTRLFCDTYKLATNFHYIKHKNKHFIALYPIMTKKTKYI
jgi:hypothetical protein